LNLTVASRIYLLEPQWNPFIESQAVGRAFRLGQTQQVSVVRYIMAGTVEKVSLTTPPRSFLLYTPLPASIVDNTSYSHLKQAIEDRQKNKLQLAGSGFGKGKDEQAAGRFKELTVSRTSNKSG
jgi:SWI/SNF-related matrix-associated actin-dependent regulator of chromatin subfamily A3